MGKVETGAAIAIYMESGGREWGDASGAMGLLREIAEGTELGKMIGSGAVATGKKRGHKRVPAVKGQAIPAYDPRGLKGMGLGYATSNRGACHLRGYTAAAELGGGDSPVSFTVPTGNFGNIFAG